MRRYLLMGVFGFVAALMWLALGASPAAADGIIIPQPPPDRPPVAWRDIPLTVKYHRVDVTIQSQVATTHVDQVFVNDATYPVEGQYVFPLPEDAAISSFDMWVDGQKVEGRLLGRDEARAIYEDIVRRQRDPALLEYAGRGAFQASIFPIPPHGERRIELTYTQVLSQDSGLVHYRYPLNTEKFSARPLAQVAVTVKIAEQAPLRAIYSPSHAISISRDGDRKATVSYEAVQVRPDKDFELFYSLSADAVAVNLMSYQPVGEEGFFLLLVTPPVQTSPGAAVAKDVVLVLDTSGSMAGDKMTQAKAAADYVLDHLGEGDRFNIVSFSTATRLFAASPVSLSRRAEGHAFVKDLQANGSTDINRALLEAVAGADPSRPTIVIFCTDGLPTMGEVDPDRIVANVAGAAPKSVRLFAFGVGTDVDTVLLDQLSSQARGSSAYIKAGQSLNEVISGFYARVSAPVLVDVTLSLTGATIEDVYPYPLPDLFAGSQLVVAGRYRQGGSVALQLSGTVNGQPQAYRYADLQLVQRGGNEFIPQLWAQRKIGYLLSEIRLHGANQELVKSVVDLSTRYGIVTPYTSFLVQEPNQALTDAGRNQISGVQPAPTMAPAPGYGGRAPSAAATAAPAAAAPAFAAPAPRSGAAAVQRSDTEAQLQAGEYAAGQAASVRQVGDKAFLLADGGWIDTSFDKNTMSAEPVAFGGDRYFQLLAQYPDLGRYLALGDQVTVVLDGRAYAVGAAGAPGAAAAVTPAAATPKPAVTIAATGLPRTATPATVATSQPRTATPRSATPGAATPGAATPAATTTLAPATVPAVAPTPQPVALAGGGDVSSGAPAQPAQPALPGTCSGAVVTGLLGLLAPALALWRRRP